MIKKTSLITIILITRYIGCIGQPNDIFPFLKDDTLVKVTYGKEVLQHKETYLKSLDKKYIKEYKDIYNYVYGSISETVTGVSIITHKETTQYLQQLVQEIFRNNEILKSLTPRILFSRDLNPNAYTMADGTIVLNAGLLLQLKNEAEIIFVLCHELAHYYLEHNRKAIQKYVESVNDKELQKQIKAIQKQAYNQNKQITALTKGLLLDTRKHSRENETEADAFALKLMKNTNYSLAAIQECLAILDSLHENIYFKQVDISKVFHSSAYPFKQLWIEKESLIFEDIVADTLTKEEKEDLSTHPNCKARSNALSNFIKEQQTTLRKTFVVSEEKFTQLKKQFYIEAIENTFKENLLSQHLYYSVMLLQESDYKKYAVYNILRCFNTLYEKQQNHTLGLAIDAENKLYTKDYNLLLRMLNRLSLKEMASINYHFGLAYANEYKESASCQEAWQQTQQIFKQK
jgi:Zn-dependent protease with chaperone function